MFIFVHVFLYHSGGTCYNRLFVMMRLRLFVPFIPARLNISDPPTPPSFTLPPRQAVWSARKKANVTTCISEMWWQIMIFITLNTLAVVQQVSAVTSPRVDTSFAAGGDVWFRFFSSVLAGVMCISILFFWNRFCRRTLSSSEDEQMFHIASVKQDANDNMSC